MRSSKKDASELVSPRCEWDFLRGLLLSAVSGQSYDAHMTERVFAPARMKDTRVQRRPPLDGIAEPTRWDGALHVAVAPFDPMVDEANGGIVSTVLDLVRWETALDRHTLVTAATRALMWTPAMTSEGPVSYELGFGLSPVAGHARVGHDGGGPGSATAFAKFPDDRLTVILLARGEGTAGEVELIHRFEVVPEPGTYALLAAGLVGLVVVRFNRSLR